MEEQSVCACPATQQDSGFFKNVDPSDLAGYLNYEVMCGVAKGFYGVYVSLEMDDEGHLVFEMI